MTKGEYGKGYYGNMFKLTILLLWILVTLSTADTLTYEFDSTENGAEGKIECKVGDQIEVSFAENSSAGYQWQIVETTLQADTVTSIFLSFFCLMFIILLNLIVLV